MLRPGGCLQLWLQSVYATFSIIGTVHQSEWIQCSASVDFESIFIFVSFRDSFCATHLSVLRTYYEAFEADHHIHCDALIDLDCSYDSVSGCFGPIVLRHDVLRQLMDVLQQRRGAVDEQLFHLRGLSMHRLDGGQCGDAS